MHTTHYTLLTLFSVVSYQQFINKTPVLAFLGNRQQLPLKIFRLVVNNNVDQSILATLHFSLLIPYFGSKYILTEISIMIDLKGLLVCYWISGQQQFFLVVIIMKAVKC